ncbi:MAG TPA: hypothetical protein P5318_03580 [Candidatus Hydrogenedentes bacterium]|nr:hypothetical protein [Candidatus Hydrogenedentota bacterium]HPC17910.1 hypothetical protein [Candidatus Hydrogenedentota bacterium]HRT19183.1 hypothetical protein [Candidatus Hydrogenedentota bacterium]HRT66436.1 hypothetical protein [Candidatus Hydrogenedentota bacterium]
MKPRSPYRPGLFRYLWVCGIAMALGWGIRGQIGHERGAMLAGVLGALAVILVTPDRRKRLRFAWVCMGGGIGLAIGGSMSYGTVAGSLGKPDCAILCTSLLLLKGSIWGAIGGGGLGMALSDVRYRARDALWLLPLTAIYLPASAWHPDGEWSRYDNTWGLLAAGLAFVAWLRFVKRDRAAFFAAVMSAAGFGMGFPLGSWCCVFGERTGLPIDWWKVAEMTWGLCGGLSWGVAVRAMDEDAVSPPEPLQAWPAALGIVYAAWFVPLWNGLNVFTYWGLERRVMPAGIVAVYGLLAAAALAGLIFWMRLADWRTWNETKTAKALMAWIMTGAFCLQFVKMAYPDGMYGVGFWFTQIVFFALMMLLGRHVAKGTPRVF